MRRRVEIASSPYWPLFAQRCRWPAKRPVVRQFLVSRATCAQLRPAEIGWLNPRFAQQFGNHPFVHIAVLAQVERREMEPEGFDRTDQPPQCAAAGKRAFAFGGQR
jgi:hypothetical protein